MSDQNRYYAREHLKLEGEKLVKTIVRVDQDHIIWKLKGMIDPKYRELLNDDDFEQEAVRVIKKINF